MLKRRREMKIGIINHRWDVESSNASEVSKDNHLLPYIVPPFTLGSEELFFSIKDHTLFFHHCREYSMTLFLCMEKTWNGTPSFPIPGL